MLAIRNFEANKANYQALFDIIDATWTDEKVDVDSFMHMEKNRNPKHYFGRVVAEVDKQIVGSCMFSETWWTTVPNEYRINVSVLPSYRKQGIGSALYDYAAKQIVKDGHTIECIRSSSREDQSAGNQFLLKRSFVEDNRYPRSELQLAKFVTAPFAHYEQRMADQGIVIKPLSQVIPTDSGWQQKIYELSWVFEQDEPTPEEPTKIPFDEWVKDELENPQFRPEGWAMALDGERYAGMSCLWPDKHFPDRLHTGWTGVDRPYRKRGIATAMKLKAIEYARAYGASHIRTDNHEENWMFQINLKLGFEPLPAWLSYKKSML